MYLESELYTFILIAFVCVALLTLIILGFLFWKTENRAIIWFIGQLFTLSGSFFFFFQALTYLPNQGNCMYSEDQSMRIVIAGLLWAVSMICMLLGIYRLLRKGPVVHQF